MAYTARQAAAAAGVATSTITKAIKTGKISAQRDEQGSWSIEPAELHRVYPPNTEKALSKASIEREAKPENGVENRGLDRLVESLQQQLDDLRASNLRALADKDGVIDDLRTDRDDWKGQAQRALALLPVAAPPPAAVQDASNSGQERPAPRSWRRWLGLVPSNG